MNKLSDYKGTMGTLPVFMTAISTILGAILFLRFGYALGHLGLVGALAIVLIGHLVTIPTAMAVAEIATNQKVEGGGAYFMISRSFGLNIGASIGIALFLSQAISVAFYIIAFAEACQPFMVWLNLNYAWPMVPKEVVSMVSMVLLSLLMLSKGANIGVKALYIVVAVLFVSLGMFFAGDAYSQRASSFTEHIAHPDSFFYVFTIIFPAFTGIAAGLGLSGDLKDPKKSIPRGTLWATIGGIIIYVLVCFKLYFSASPEDLSSDQLIMSKIAVWGPIIPIGLGCAAISSALGSVIIAPRTLQALGFDNIFSSSINKFISKGSKKENEPINSSIITCIIAFVFTAVGDINFVAQIISMFFMVTYGAICLISFLEHLAADPSYRPTFKSKWYVSLFGAILSFYLMFKMNFTYAVLALVIMLGIYIWVSRSSSNKEGLVGLFKGLIFQITRELQVYLQRRDKKEDLDNWRPFMVSISSDTFKRTSSFNLVRWLSHRYGIGTYIHYIKGFLSEETYNKAKNIKDRLVNITLHSKSKVILDTIISPSYTSAIAQVIQVSGVSGKGNNLMLFEFSDDDLNNLKDIMSNYQLLTATEFDVCILKSSLRGFGYQKTIHIWISALDYQNSNLMILLGYILLGHPEWKDADIQIFSAYLEGELDNKTNQLRSLINEGRIPISQNNIEMVLIPKNTELKNLINQKSQDADLTLVGFHSEEIVSKGISLFDGYSSIGNILFVNAFKDKEIK